MTFPRIDIIQAWIGPALAISVLTAAAGAADGDALLIRTDLTADEIRIVEFSDQSLVHRDDKSGWVTLEIDECIGFVAPAPAAPDPTGVLVLADGQRFPGRMVVDQSEAGDVLAWEHDRLGRLDVPLDQIRAVLLDPRAELPARPRDEVVALRNGDMLEGIVVALGAIVEIEVVIDGETDVMAVPLERTAAVLLATKPRPSQGRRVWLSDGTVLDAREIRASDDGHVRLTCSWTLAGTQPVRLELEDLAAVLFDTQSMVPLGTLAPSRIDGPSTRYALPDPEIIDASAALGLARIRLRGPITARYALPTGTRRFAAEAVLPPGARRFGDYELVVYDDDREVFRAHLSGASPRASINVELAGAELSLELAPGENGPIQDELVLERAMLLVADDS